MGITILPPIADDTPARKAPNLDHYSDDDDDGGVNVGEILGASSTKSHPFDENDNDNNNSGIIITPGEVITDDPQWMRYVFPFPIFHISIFFLLCPALFLLSYLHYI